MRSGPTGSSQSLTFWCCSKDCDASAWRPLVNRLPPRNLWWRPCHHRLNAGRQSWKTS